MIEVIADLFKDISCMGLIATLFSEGLGILKTLSTLSPWPLNNFSLSGEKDTL